MDTTQESSNAVVNCLACGEGLVRRDHLGIRCGQGHDLCPECSKVYVANMLSDPETKIPARCSFWNLELNSIQVEMQMDDAQREIYIMYRAMKEVDTTVDKVVNCPFCNYFEIWLKLCTSNFFYCKRESCKKGSCSVCNKEFKVSLSYFKIYFNCGC